MVKKTRVFARFGFLKGFHRLLHLVWEVRAPKLAPLEVIDDLRDGEAKGVRIDPGKQTWQLYRTRDGT
jgi:hypothetical protein